MWQCVAVCCSVLQCVAVVVNDYNLASPCCPGSKFPHSMLSVLQVGAVCCSLLQRITISMGHVTHTNESCHTLNESCHTYEVVSHVRSQVTYRLASSLKMPYLYRSFFVAVCCSVLQCLQCVAVCGSVTV